MTKNINSPIVSLSDFEILSQTKKKYSIYDFNFVSGYSFACHRHNYSSELFYVISGTIKLSFYEDGSKSPTKTVILKAGDSYFVHPTIYHEYTSLDNSRVIVIVQPPLVYKTILDNIKVLKLKLFKKLFTK